MEIPVAVVLNARQSGVEILKEESDLSEFPGTVEAEHRQAQVNRQDKSNTHRTRTVHRTVHRCIATDGLVRTRIATVIIRGSHPPSGCDPMRKGRRD